MAHANPGPWVNHELRSREPWDSHDGIIKLLEFPKRRREMSQRAFHLYWQRHHSPHVMNLTPFAQYIRKYTTTHVLDRHSVRCPDNYETSAADGVGEIWVNRISELEDWFSQDCYADLIASDEAVFLSEDSPPMVFLAKEEILFDEDPDLRESNCVKAFLVLTAPKPNSYNEVHANISNFGRVLATLAESVPQLKRVAISHRLEDPLPLEFESCDIDGAIELHFESRDALTGFFTSAHYKDIHDESLIGTLSSYTRQFIAGHLLAIHDEFSFQPTTTQPLPFPR